MAASKYQESSQFPCQAIGLHELTLLGNSFGPDGSAQMSAALYGTCGRLGTRLRDHLPAAHPFGRWAKDIVSIVFHAECVVSLTYQCWTGQVRSIDHAANNQDAIDRTMMITWDPLATLYGKTQHPDKPFSDCSDRDSD